MATLKLSISGEFTDSPALPISFDAGETEYATLPSAVSRDTAVLSLISGPWPKAIPMGSVASPGLFIPRHCTAGGSKIEIGYTKDGAAFSAAYPRTIDFTDLSVEENDEVIVTVGDYEPVSAIVGSSYDPLSDMVTVLSSGLNALAGVSSSRDDNVITLIGVGTLPISVTKNAAAWNDVAINTPVPEYDDEWVCVQTLEPLQALVLNLADFPSAPQWKPLSAGPVLISFLLCSKPA